MSKDIDPARYFVLISTSNDNNTTSVLGFKDDLLQKDFGPDALKAYNEYRHEISNKYSEEEVEVYRQKFKDIVGIDPDEFVKLGRETKDRKNY